MGQDYQTIERIYGTAINWEKCSLITAEECKGILPPRPLTGHKGTFGHALLLAGSKGMAGAAILAAKACLRSGIGLLTVHTASFNLPLLQTAVPEAIVHFDEGECSISQLPELGKYSAIGIGPGLGQAVETQEVIHQAIRQTLKPLVLDADALNILSLHPDWLKDLPKDTVLTPHPKELERLIGKSLRQSQRLSYAQELAQQYQVIVVLKGAYTAIVNSNGEVAFNTTGNPGMGTGGSGDVLTGILTGLLGLGLSPIEAAHTAVFAHGLAGDFAARALSQTALIASDIIAFLPEVWKIGEEKQ